MMFRIVSKGDGALVIAIDDVLVVDIVADFLEEAMEPDELFEGVEKGHVFRFRTGEGDRALLLR